MSVVSGKFDLYDHISMEKMYDKGSYKASDELECFEIFKKRTGGKIYQHQKVTVTEWNQDFVKEHCKEFDFIEEQNGKVDKRYTNGCRVVTSYTYYYCGKNYSLKELNKKGVYITNEITFNTIFDLIPYYSYIICMCCSDTDKETVYISNKPYPTDEYERSMKSGGCLPYPNDYIQKLQQLTLNLAEKYYFYKLDERTKRIPLITYKPLHNGYYEILLDKPVDYMHEIKFVWKDGIIKPHWESPKVSDCEPNVILVSEQDIDTWLKDDIKTNNIELEYVEACEFPNEARDNK